MRPKFFRSLLLLASFSLPLLASPQMVVRTPPGSEARIARMEAELKAMQEEAAKDPTRPTMAGLRRQLDQMLAERNAAAPGRSEVLRLRRLTAWSFGLNLALSLALLGITGKRLMGRRHRAR